MDENIVARFNASIISAKYNRDTLKKYKKELDETFGPFYEKLVKEMGISYHLYDSFMGTFNYRQATYRDKIVDDYNLYRKAKKESEDLNLRLSLFENMFNEADKVFCSYCQNDKKNISEINRFIERLNEVSFELFRSSGEAERLANQIGYRLLKKEKDTKDKNVFICSR